MNDLDLPPRATLPPEIRDRIRARVNEEMPRPRYRAPLSVAAAVAVLAAGAVVVGQLTDGTPDGYRAGSTPPPPTTTVPGTDPLLTVTQPNAQSGEDLDHCWAAVEAGPRAGEYDPRSTWQPVYTVTRARPLGNGSLVRVTAFRATDGNPMFCEISETFGPGTDKGWMATVSDPSAAPIPLATTGDGDIYAVYFSHGLLAGVTTGVDSVKFGLSNPHPDTGESVHSNPPPVFQDETFFVEVGGLHVGSVVTATGLDGDGNEVTSGEWAYDQAKDPLTGPSLRY